MVHLRGELDPVTGAKVRKRFLQEAERLRRLDLHSPGDGKAHPQSAHGGRARHADLPYGSIYANMDTATKRVSRWQQ